MPIAARPAKPGNAESSKHHNPKNRLLHAESVPQSFQHMLANSVPGFMHEPPHVQAGLALMIWQVATKRRQHKEWFGYSSFYCIWLEQLFGRGKFQHINSRVKIFNVTPNWDITKHLTKGYALLPWVQCLVNQYLSSTGEAEELIDSQGRHRRKLPRAIASKDSNGVTICTWKGSSLVNKTPVDIDRLECLLSSPAYGDDEPLHRSILGKLVRLANTKVAGRGNVPTRYVEAQSGRLYQLGVGLQNAPRHIRHVALHGMYEYDFANCHYTILFQLMQRYGLHLPHIAHYLLHKREVRTEIAQAIGLSIDEVKECLIALLYGARASTSDETAIAQLITPAAAKRLFQHSAFAGLKGEVKAARKRILRRWPKARGHIRNHQAHGPRG